MSRTSSIGDSAELEGNLTLSDRLKVFKNSHFDPNAFVTSKCQTMNEKEIRHLCSNLVDLKKASAEEMRKSVYANYAAFIRTSREISDLEGQLISMRNFLSTQAALVHGLSEHACIDSLWAASEDSIADDHLSNLDEGELSESEDWLIELLDNFEVLLAERRVEEAMQALEKGEELATESRKKHSFSPTALVTLETAIRNQRQKLAYQLAEAISQPSTRGQELRSAVLALKTLGDAPLSCGRAYTVALSQIVFSTIAQAASDSLAVYGEEPAYTSELVTWAVRETEAFAFLLKRHVLALSAASGGLRVVAECIHICMGHCSLLEARGLSLAPVLLRLFKPIIEQAVNANLKKIEEISAALAAADDWLLIYPPAGGRPFSSSASLSSAMASQPKLSSSANRFNSMIQDFLEDVGPLESLQLDGSALGGVLQVFNSYVNLLMRALPSSSETEESLEGSGSKIVRIAETESQQLALLANASLLADDLLPYAAMKLLPLPPRMDEQPKRSSERQSRLPEQREWKKKLQRSVDRLRDSFCRQHALDLIFTENGDTHLNAYIYTSLDDNVEEPEWFPSPILQELFMKLTRMASITTDMFIGRERFATVLLMRLTETVILWLSDDQTFWEEIEEGPKPLGPLGLQQLYLDMEFVLLFSSQGRYLSRNLHQVIKNIIARAIDAVAASGVDPYSTLPEDDWFAEQNLYLQSYLMGVTRIQPLMSTESSSPKKRPVIHQLPAFLAVDLFARCYHRWNVQYTVKPLTDRPSE
ncbi:EXOCYST COMPLEX COMPONENT EXO84A [Salix viminalis]|uniref:EXOCYST COMPLEX COMPONENT EXO84A n=1 Tax=Salix viminalis TaxID=40686 RepID=A0A9Q0SEI8_SALVM|nr:EXOCYST COMPLEX COMPONENT EXO84A [Salix viminalis]